VTTAPDATLTISPCGFCSGPVTRDSGPQCELCGAFHHLDCWNEFGGCVTFGCPHSPDMKIYQGGPS
jgi:hypothetical protein